MTNRVFSALFAVACLCTVPLAAQAQDCLRLGQIDSFSAIKGTDRAFVVTDKLHRRFKVNLTQRCGGLDFNMAVGFKTLDSGPLACIERGDYVLSRDPGMAGARCPISKVEIYTPAMEAADKSAAAAKAR